MFYVIVKVISHIHTYYMKYSILDMNTYPTVGFTRSCTLLSVIIRMYQLDKARFFRFILSFFFSSFGSKWIIRQKYLIGL